MSVPEPSGSAAVDATGVTLLLAGSGAEVTTVRLTGSLHLPSLCHTDQEQPVLCCVAQLMSGYSWSGDPAEAPTCGFSPPPRPAPPLRVSDHWPSWQRSSRQKEKGLYKAHGCRTCKTLIEPSSISSALLKPFKGKFLDTVVRMMVSAELDPLLFYNQPSILWVWIRRNGGIQTLMCPTMGRSTPRTNLPMASYNMAQIHLEF